MPTNIEIVNWVSISLPGPTFDEGCIHDTDKNTFDVSFVSAAPGDTISFVEMSGTNVVVNQVMDETAKAWVRSHFD